MPNERLKRDVALMLLRERIADRMNIVKQICETCREDMGALKTTVAEVDLQAIIAYADEVKAKAIPTRYGLTNGLKGE